MASTPQGSRSRAPIGSPDSDQVTDRVVVGLIGSYCVVTAAIPYQYGTPIAAILVIALLITLGRGRAPGSAAVIWITTLGLLGGVGALIGSLNDNPGVVPTLTIFVIEPILIGTLFVAHFRARRDLEALARILDLSLIAVGSLGIALFIGTRLGVSIPEFLIDPRYSYFDLQGDTLQTNYQGYNALVFLAAYGLVRIGNDTLGRLWRLALLVAVLSGILLSGRRILFIAVPLAILFVFVAHRLRHRRGSRLLAARQLVGAVVGGVPLLYIVTQLGGIGLGEALDRAVAQVTLTDDDVRGYQSARLLEAWSERPLFGHGSGAVLSGYQRNAAAPWTFELTYHAILFYFGLVGLVVLSIWGLWCLMALASGMSGGSSIEAALLAGFCSSVVAAASNPYFFKIDGMWMVMAPFAAACIVAAERRAQT